MSKILHLKSENIQRIKVVEITPTGNLVVVGGNNGHGKTTTLDSIMYVIGGEKSLSAKPVREGSDKGVITIETEDFVATRTIYANGKPSELEFRPKTPTNLTPHKFFESIRSKLTFDPLGFAEMDWKKQVEIIKSLIPFDFSGNETYRKSKYEERTFVNRDLKQKQAENEANPFDPTMPVDEMPFDLGELERISQREVAKAQLEGNVNRGKAQRLEIASRIEGLKAEIRTLEIKDAEIGTWLEANEPKLQEFGDLDALVADVKARNAAQHEKNARIRKNAEAKRVYSDLQVLQQQSNALTAELERLDAEKMAAIEGAALPVTGLSFTDERGVLYNGIPFPQLSGAERLKVSLAMGIALNPSLRILLIRDGSLLDAENLRIVGEMAQAHNMQIWIERVGKGEECSVVLEDGMIVENRMNKEEDNARGKDERDDSRHSSGAA